MKPILYLAVMSLLIARTRQQLLREYNLLPFGKMADTIPTDESSTDGLLALNFTSSHQKLSVNDLIIDKPTMKAPYILQTVFKLYEENTYFLFSLEDKDKKPQLAVKFSQVEINIMRISLSLKEGDEDVAFQMSNLINDWIDLLFYVEDDKVSLYLNCSAIETQESLSDKTIYFDKYSNLILGKAETYDVERNFAGAVKQIKLFPEVDDSTIGSMLCSDDSVLHRLIDDYADTDTGEIPPEKLTLGTTRGDGVIEKEPDPDLETEPVKGDKGDTGKPGIQGERGGKGEKGEKGEKGYAGIKGEPGEAIKGEPGMEGPSGPKGPIGPPGKRGEEGKCECSEELVSSLIRSMPELKGPVGETGPRGDDGPRGEPGRTGKPGPQGDRGPEGLRGETGETGDVGRTGNDGVPGQKGEPGKDGRPGERGTQGLVGPPGPPGPVYVETEEEKKAKQVFIPGVRGDTGPIGPSGPMGPRGYKGDTGERGIQGHTGEKGEQGHKGAVGPKGEKGERGIEGEDGLPGSPGNHGKPGERGEKGDRGDKGSPGLAGLPAKLTDLLDASIDPLENAQIVEILRGRKGDAGVDGKKGAKGDHGLDGAPGTPGEDGHDGEKGPKGPEGPKGDTGPIGPRGHKGAQGEPGPPGVVPAEHIALMKGSKGDRGVPGLKGPRGPNGPRGPRGSTGPTGSKGSKGETGQRGPVGPMGLSGFNGTDGLRGEKGECAIPDNFEQVKGDKGDRGDPGIPGKDGSPGPPGPNAEGTKGSTGEPGPPGPPGPPGISISGPKGEPGSSYSFSSGFMHEDDDSYTTNTVIFKSRKALVKRTSSTPVGTLAYVLQEDILLIRVQSGWRHVEMGSIFPTIESTTHGRPYPIISSTGRPISEKPGRSYIRLAALNDPYTGKVHDRMRSGLSGADFECNQQSLRAGFGGNFRAFLTNKIQNAVSIVNSNERDLAVRNLHGELLFHSWNSIFDGSGGDFVHVNIRSFDGRNVMIDSHWPKKAVWHGSDEMGIRLPESFCNEWDDESNYSRGMASSLYNKKLLSQEKFTCDNKLIVLCVEVSAAEPRRTRHYMGRRNSYYHRPTHRNEIGRA